jgi:hypothetical protein
MVVGTAWAVAALGAKLFVLRGKLRTDQLSLFRFQIQFCQFSIFRNNLDPVKILMASDKYKGSLTGPDFCNAVVEGIAKAFPRPPS